MATSSRKRVSRRPKRNTTEHISREEERSLRLALENSKNTTRRSTARVPDAPVFYPTMEEFRKPLEYIVRLHSEGLVDDAGICKIVPPKGWKCPKPKLKCDVTFPTKLQQLRHLQEGRLFRDGKKYNLPGYKAMADRYRAAYITKNLGAALGLAAPPPAPAASSALDLKEEPLHGGASEAKRIRLDPSAAAAAAPMPLVTPTSMEASVASSESVAAAAVETPPPPLVEITDPDQVADALEKEYWRLVETSTIENVQVEYANDIDSTSIGSGFPCEEAPEDADPAARFTVSETARRSVERARKSEELEMDDDAFYKLSGWNLNNTSSWEESMLQCLPDAINGISVPWMYLGMIFATFCWHIEDNFLYSINYMHAMPEGCDDDAADGEEKGEMTAAATAEGESVKTEDGAASASSASASSASTSSAVTPRCADTSTVKTWYGIPQHAYLEFEKCLKSHCPEAFDKSPDLLYRLTTLLSPNHLMQQGVPVVKLRQHPGEFVVTFPRAYHAGFSHGFTCAEAVNFAPVDWIPHGRSCLSRYRRRGGRPSVFNHEKLICDMARNAYTLSRPEHCDMIVAELRNIIVDEESGLQLLKNLEITNKHRLENEALICDDDLRQCIVCQHTCYLSSVVCQCSSSNVSCLRCPHHMCDCNPNDKCVSIVFVSSPHALSSYSSLTISLSLSLSPPPSPLLCRWLIYWFEPKDINNLIDSVNARKVELLAAKAAASAAKTK